MFVDEFSAKIWADKYQYKGETFSGFCHRVSSNVFPDDEEREKDLNALLLDFRIMFGGRINSNIGVDEKGLTLFNCFIESINKNPDSLEGIMEMITNYVLTLKTEGGVGFCADFFRPSKTIIRKIGVASPGSIKFLEMFDKASEIITSGSVDKDDCYQGTPTKNSIRKGATMVTMSCSHPDIEEFITAKSTPNKLTKMNMSVLITDDFMDAVRSNADWDLWFPDINYEKYDEEWDGNLSRWKKKGNPTVVYKTVKATDLWDLIMKSSFNRNEPGILFIDNARKMNNISYLNGDMLSSNPCQPAWATVLTPKGLTSIGKINIGDVIWSEDGWVNVINKVSSGVKDVYKYKTSSSVFYGTTNHRVVSMGKKVEARNALFIDALRGKAAGGHSDLNIQAIMDGIVVGDGSVHKASNNLVHLYIGKDDYDYHDSLISELITKHRPGLKDTAWEISTTISAEELPATYDRKVPDRYMFGSTSAIKSFLIGLFSANGTVINKKGAKAVRLKATSAVLVEQVQIMLSAVGIKSFITTNKEKSVAFSNGDYICKKSYDLNIVKDTHTFELEIGFLQKYKNDVLHEINKRPPSNREKVSYEIVDRQFIKTEEVYDLTVNGDHHTYWTGGCNVSNCGEVIGHTGIEYVNGEPVELGDVCNLASINLPKFYDVEENKFCVTEFKEAVDIMVRSLENIIDVSGYPLDIYEKAAKLKRKIGIGVMGVGSLMMMMNLRYGSEECIDVLGAIMSEFINQAYRSSALLAKDKGPFKLYSPELLDLGYVKHGKLNKGTIDLIRMHGLRHSALSAIAPNGTLSIVAGNVSGGVEPVFAREFSRWNRVEGKSVDFKYPNIHKGEWFETDYLKEDKVADEVVLYSTDNKYRIDKNTGLCERVTIMDYGYRIAKEKGYTETATAMELNVDEHLNVLKLLSSYVDQSSSKTINLPNNITLEDFKSLYGQIHSYGIKGCTTYREGTSVAVLEVQKKEKEKSVKVQQEEFLEAFREQEDGIIMDNVKLPDEYPAKGYIIKSEGNRKFYLHVCFKDLECKKPFALFVNTNNVEDNVVTYNAIEKLEEIATFSGLRPELIEEVRKKSANQKNQVKICRMLGLLLRHNVEVITIVKGLDELMAGPWTFVFRIKKFLGQFVEDHDMEGMVCPECGEKSIRFTEGCYSCFCGYSRCG